MNVNGIDPNLQAQATKLLQSKEKVDHSKEDLEVLWEYTKQTQDLDLGGVSDEDIIAMFDTLDTEGNTIKNSLALLLNAISDGAIPNSGTNNSTNTSQKVPSETSKPTTSGNSATSTPSAPVSPSVPENNTTVKDEIFTVPSEKPSLEENKADNTVTTPPTASTEAANTATSDAPKANEKVFIQLYPKATQTLDINGKSYTISNLSKTSNNFAYYMKGDTLMIEGSDLQVSANDDVEISDNVKVMGNRNSIDMKKGADTIEAEGDMNMIYGGEGNDFIKIRGDMNSADMSTDNDTIWIAGNSNQAHGQGGEDNFFAMGAANNLFGQDGTDAAYYNSTDSVDGMFTAGVGQELRIENKITDGKPFEDWVHGNEDESGPPYNDIPKPLDGHEVRAYDNNTYTDKYEKEPIYYTEYRDIAYRELDVLTTQNKETGEGTVTKFDNDGVESSKVVLNPDGSASVKVGDNVTSIPANEITYYDENGNVVNNTGSLEATLTKLATDQLSIGNKSGAIKLPETSITNPDTPSVDNPNNDKPTDEAPENKPNLPTTTDLAELLNKYNTSVDSDLEKAGQEYISAMSNKNNDGTFNTADDATASQKYANTTKLLNAKKEVVINSGLPLINQASNEYSNAENVSDAYLKSLQEAIKIALDANKLYFENKDSENEEKLKADAQKANAKLQELMNNK